MRVCIVTGGRISKEFLLNQLRTMKYHLMIAVDHGADFFTECDYKPHHVVGDMDSADSATKEAISSWEGCTLHKFPAEKDETDTELAISLAIENRATEIHIYGATGSRMDHMLGNIHIMKKALDAGVLCAIIDEHNKIRLIKDTLTINKDSQYGNYVSFLPWYGDVTGVCLRGMKYPLEDAVLPYGKALGVSNEVMDEVATVIIGSGVAVMIESKD